MLNYVRKVCAWVLSVALILISMPYAASANAADDVLVFGGTLRDTFSDVKPAPDGGFVAAGHTQSNDGYLQGFTIRGYTDALLEDLNPIRLMG